MAKAAKGKKSGKGDGGKAGAKKGDGVDLGVVPINYLKDGQHPAIKPDEEYPEWLWHLPVSLNSQKRNNSHFLAFDPCLSNTFCFCLSWLANNSMKKGLVIYATAILLLLLRLNMRVNRPNIEGAAFFLIFSVALMPPTKYQEELRSASFSSQHGAERVSASIVLCSCELSPAASFMHRGLWSITQVTGLLAVVRILFTVNRR